MSEQQPEWTVIILTDSVPFRCRFFFPCPYIFHSMRVESTQQLIDSILEVGAARDGTLHDEMYIPRAPDGSSSNDVLNQQVSGTDLLEAFEWYSNRLPSTYDPDNDVAFDGLPPPSSQDTQSPFFVNNRNDASNWGYKKWAAIDPWWLLFIGMDPDTATSADSKNTLFSKNLQDRQLDTTTPNIMKMQYMSALTCDKLPLYQNKIDAAIDRVRDDITNENNELGVLRSWSRHSLELFIDLHFEGPPTHHPNYIREYVEAFVQLQAPGTTEYVQHHQELLAKGACLSFLVRMYVEDRIQHVIDNNLQENFLYHWHVAGLPTDAILAEIVHNMLAWGQYVNILFLTLRAKLQGYVGIRNVDVGPEQITDETIDFFQLMAAQAGNDEVSQLNVVREAFRYFTPVGAFFSNFHDTDSIDDDIPLTSINEANLQTSFHSTSMIEALGDNYNIATQDTDHTVYNVNRYAEFAQGCPYASVQLITDVTSFFFTSPIDGETIVPQSHWEMFPVFDSGNDDDNNDGIISNGPKYCPFGLGYRRCPAELFNLNMLKSLLIGLNGLNFATRNNEDDLFASIDADSNGDFSTDAVPLGKARALDNIIVVNNIMA